MRGVTCRRLRTLLRKCLMIVGSMFLTFLVLTDRVPSKWWRWALNTPVLVLEELPAAPLTTQPDPRGRRRLGNVIFMYSSLNGIARDNNMSAFLPCSHVLRRYFRIPTPCLRKDPENMALFYERKSATYDSRTTRLEAKPTILVGFYQSWKYFRNIEEDLRKDLAFRNYITREARWHMDRAERQTSYKDIDHVKVGIHIRRGDMWSNDEIKSLGYKTADVTYIHKAMELLKTKLEGKRVLFIVCSDDIVWSEAHIDGRNVAFVKSRDDVIDLAVLSLCDHLIMTVGTYGWWGGWLAGGMVVYYKDYPRPGSALYYTFNQQDHFPPEWIGL